MRPFPYSAEYSLPPPPLRGDVISRTPPPLQKPCIPPCGRCAYSGKGKPRSQKIQAYNEGKFSPKLMSIPAIWSTGVFHVSRVGSKGGQAGGNSLPMALIT